MVSGGQPLELMDGARPGAAPGPYERGRMGRRPEMIP